LKTPRAALRLQFSAALLPRHRRAGIRQEQSLILPEQSLTLMQPARHNEFAIEMYYRVEAFTGRG
jgi:hypothetical protein